jgi:pimeloyl-ACP methyl ester carboxylesterase
VAQLEPIVGRYLHMECGGRAYRVYFEEAGAGIPLVCLHTAGADGRQFRHLLNDTAVTDRFRVLAFDLPWHGKSLPPAGWQDEEYRLTTRQYVDFIRAFIRALELDRPVILGCSVGGKVLLQIALEWPQECRALIALEAAAQQQPWYALDWLDHPHTHSAEVCAAIVWDLMAPQSPPERRHEVWWTYAQGGPGVFKGDLYFYRVDADWRDRMPQIDTRQCPLYLMTGAYDFSCTPEDTERTAALIPGAKVTIMEALGHFPMAESPDQFRRYLLPVLAEIAANEAAPRADS